MTDLRSERGELHHLYERRGLAFSDAECRTDSADGGMTFRGYASIFEAPYQIADAYGEYTETVRRGAFDKTIGERADVCFLINHSDAPLARTKSGTLSISSDAKGLLASARLDPANPRALELRSMVSRGDMDQMSFTFKDLQPSWNASYTERSLRQVSLAGGDVSVVNFAANPATAGTLDMRSLAAVYDREIRAKYSSAQLQAMLKKGWALENPAGEPSYPIGDEADLRLAIHAIGRGSGDHDKIRKYVIGRAVALGLKALIPENWNADGSLKQSNSLLFLGEHRAPSHGPFIGTHSHEHATRGNAGQRHTHVHTHGDGNPMGHDHHSTDECACCDDCPGGSCDGGCCSACPLSIFNSDTSSDNLENQSPESLSAMREQIEINRRKLRIRAGGFSATRSLSRPASLDGQLAEIEARIARLRGMR
jgi:hypothetical protein